MPILGRVDREHATLLLSHGVEWHFSCGIKKILRMSDTEKDVSQKPTLTGAHHCFAALKYSLQGFRSCFREESAFRQECALAIPHFVLLCIIPMELCMRVFLGTLWFLLVAVELLNTAIESVVNLASPNYHDLAKKAKDCGSAAVMTLILSIALCWTIAIAVCVWEVSK